MAKSKEPKNQIGSPIGRPDFRKIILPDGVRVLTERHPQSRAVSCGLWVNRGTRHERVDEAGLAHFVEHLVFKRTKKRSAYRIARDMEAVGGDLNAFTSRENTCFVTHSLSEHLGLSLDVLSDLVCQPLFDPSDIRKEKQVVIQEIQMAEDQLEDAIFDRYFELAFPGAPVGRNILGSKKSIEEMRRETIVGYHKRQFTSPNLLVSVAGNVEHDEVLELVLKHLKPPKTPKADRSTVETEPEASSLQPFREAIRRPAEQVHILIGLPSADFRDRLRFEAFVVNTLLGGGMTSRLYQQVREERGLVYSIYSQLITFADAGMNLIYAGTDPKKMPTVVEIILKELKKLKKNGIKKSDLDLFKTQVKGSILLGADDVENRMNSLAVNEMVFGRYRAVEDVMHDVQAVSLDSVHEYIERYIDLEKMGILLMGAVPEAPTKKWLENL
jgi:predicted Zn-dependent peptidase